MSAEKGSNTKIYVRLLNEGIEVKRPVSASLIEKDVYLILSDNHDDFEDWEFPPGTKVQCEIRETQYNEKFLLAVKQVK